MHSSMKKDVSMTVPVCSTGLRFRQTHNGGTIQAVMNTNSKSFLKRFTRILCKYCYRYPTSSITDREKALLRFWMRNRYFLKWIVTEKKNIYIENTLEGNQSAQSSTFEEIITGSSHPFSRLPPLTSFHRPSSSSSSSSLNHQKDSQFGTALTEPQQ